MAEHVGGAASVRILLDCLLASRATLAALCVCDLALSYGDRQFYEDWWTSRSFSMYYRKWNMVVHEWLYYYLYQDSIRFVASTWCCDRVRLSAQDILRLRCQVLARQAVQGQRHGPGVRTLCHRTRANHCVRDRYGTGRPCTVCVTSLSLPLGRRCSSMPSVNLRCAGFWFPALLLMFGGPGVFFVKLSGTNRFANVFLWLMLCLGMGLLLVLYSREWFARFGAHPVNYPVR
jgi:hypothetical protein